MRTSCASWLPQASSRALSEARSVASPTDARWRMRRRRTIRAGRQGQPREGKARSTKYSGGAPSDGGDHQAWLVYLFHATSNDPPNFSAPAGRSPHRYQSSRSHDCCAPAAIKPLTGCCAFTCLRCFGVHPPFLAPTRSDCSECGREAASCRLIGNIAPQANSHSLSVLVLVLSSSRFYGSM